jgi:hypothetical protein
MNSGVGSKGCSQNDLTGRKAAWLLVLGLPLLGSGCLDNNAETREVG